MDQSILRRYDRPAPRYTSYPTAPHFHDGVDASTYRTWLHEVAGDESISVYVHVPFCTAMCWYCGCHTKVVRRYAPVADYAALLNREIGLLAESLPGRPPIAHVHWGGGTPTMLSESDFLRLMTALRESFRFGAAHEVAVEIDPRTMTEAKAAALARAGVTRTSLGVQDLNEEIQAGVNRIQPYDVVEHAVASLRDAGIDAINVDLMYGLPGQTVDHVSRTIDQVVALAPDRIALFGYAHVPWMKTHQRLIDEAALPTARERFVQAETAAARLVDLGYRRIGLDHFARPDDGLARALDQGRLRRNFQGYTDDQARVLLGLGASAIGCLPQGYVQNAVPFKAYGEAIQSGRLAVAKGLGIDDDDRLRRAVIERLMCGLSVDLDAECRRFDLGADRFGPELDALATMARDGLVELSDNRVTVPEQARPLLRSVCAVFDRYLETGAARHSRAV